jgi:hypothetical protein
MEVIKTDWVVVALPMQHHAVRRRSRLFVAHIDVARWTNVMIDDLPPARPLPDQLATGFAAPLDFLEATLFRGHRAMSEERDPYDKLAAETLMKELLVGLIAVVCVAD